MAGTIQHAQGIVMYIEIVDSAESSGYCNRSWSQHVREDTV